MAALRPAHWRKSSGLVTLSLIIVAQHTFASRERRGRVCPPPSFSCPPPHTDAVYGNNAVKALHTMPSLITQRSLRRGWRRRECKLC